MKPVYVDDHDNADWIKHVGRTVTASGPLEVEETAAESAPKPE